jgi:photosystem II stability/assembly factor-like uncharacterized protein
MQSFSPFLSSVRSLTLLAVSAAVAGLGAGCGFQVANGDSGMPVDAAVDAALDATPGPDLATPPDLTPPATWTLLSSKQSQDLFAVSGAPGSVFAVGAKGTMLYTTDGAQTWHPISNPNGMNDLEAAFQFPNSNDAWIAGDFAFVIHSTSGGSGPFNNLPMNTAGLLLTGFWGSPSGDLYTVGFNRSSSVSQFGILHSTGGTTAFDDVTPSSVGLQPKARAVWGSSSTDVYVVGEQGVIAHAVDPMTWTPQTSNVTGTLNGVWGASASDVWAVGAGGVILHSTGSGDWLAQQSGTGVELRAVWGTSASSVYVVGAFGTVLHTSDGGQNWSVESSGTTAQLNGVFATDPLDVYVVGAGGVVLHKP